MLRLNMMRINDIDLKLLPSDVQERNMEIPMENEAMLMLTTDESGKIDTKDGRLYGILQYRGRRV